MNRKTREIITALTFLTPNLLGFLCFTLFPVIFSFIIAFCHWNVLNGLNDLWFAGFSNLLWVLGDPEFWYYAFNTLFLMLGLPLSMAASLFLAILLNRRFRGIAVFRMVYFLPSICAGVAIFLLWKWIFNPDIGLFNSIIRNLGSVLGQTWDGPLWLASTTWAKPALIIMGLWMSMGGYNMVLYLAALQSIPPELYEAADIDGAGSWRKFWHITWPLISPTTFFILIMGIIAGLQGGFEQAYEGFEGVCGGQEKDSGFLSG